MGIYLTADRPFVQQIQSYELSDMFANGNYAYIFLFFSVIIIVLYLLTKYRSLI